MQALSREKKQKKTAGSFVVALLAAFLSAGGWILALVNLQHNDILREKTRAHNMLASVSYTMQMTLKDYFAITSFWAEYIKNKGLPAESDFSVLTSSLDPENKSFVSAALAPEGIISYNYTKMGGSNLGVNLFTDQLRGPEAYWSRLTVQTTLSGPFSDSYAGMVFEIRTPVFTQTADGKSEFWGFTLASFTETQFFDEARLGMFREEGYDYHLKKINTQKGKLEMVSCTTPRPLKNPVSLTFPLQNTAWTLLIAPQGGWVRKPFLLVVSCIALIFTLLISFAASSFWKLITDERAFKRMSYIDSLTGLFNSRKFYEDLEALQKKLQPYGLLYLDLNDFKPVNDTYGHGTGDQLLSVVALKLQRCVRGGTGVYRVGGDEFTIVIPSEISDAVLENLCLRIKASLSQRIQLQSASVHIGTSIGYARCPADGFQYDEIIQKAEAIMYADKKQQHAKR